MHVPFCRHRCGYCNFSVVAGRDDLIERFSSAIYKELEPLGCPPIDTLFIGGGTPTHLSLDQLDEFLARLSHCFAIQPGAELTVEANPEDITPEKLELLVNHGINRISLGVQSFNDAKLKTLERSHTGDAAARIVRETARHIGNVSIDLIFGAPGETTGDFKEDLAIAYELPIKHLSTYALTFEKGTSFWSRQLRGELTGVDEGLEVEMFEAARAIANQRGAMHYEVSNFAFDGFQCKHNVAYWQGRGWYAAGPGAARFVSGRRDVNHRSTTTYLNRLERGQDVIAESESLTLQQYARERLAFGMRMLDGVDVCRLSEETGVDLMRQFEEKFEDLIQQGLIKKSEDQGIEFKLTNRGILFADTVAGEFL